MHMNLGAVAGIDRQIHLLAYRYRLVPELAVGRAPGFGGASPRRTQLPDRNEDSDENRQGHHELGERGAALIATQRTKPSAQHPSKLADHRLTPSIVLCPMPRLTFSM